LFARLSHEDPVWLEQVSWMRAASVEAANGTLAAIKPYSQHPLLRKEPYGGKAKGILEQYEKYVPRCFVPDKYAVGVGGHSGVVAGAWQRFGLGSGDSPSGPEVDKVEPDISAHYTHNNPQSMPQPRIHIVLCSFTAG